MNLLVALFALTMAEPAVTQTMPEIAPNDVALDHYESMVIRGEAVKLRDQHVKKFSETKTEAWMGLIYFDPATDTPWFAIMGHFYIPNNKAPEIVVFEYKDGNWIFILDITATATDEYITDMLQKRYGISEPRPTP